MFLFALSLIGYTDRILIASAAISIQQDLFLSNVHWGWVVGAFALGYALFQLPSGLIADRMGASQLLILIAAAWSLFTFATGTATTLFGLLTWRFFFGIAEAGMYPASSTIIATRYPPQKRAWAQAVLWVASRLGAAVCPLLLSSVNVSLGWRACFYLTALPGLGWAACWWFWNRRSLALPQTSPVIVASKMAHGSSTVRLRPGAFRAIVALNVMYFGYCYGAYFFLAWMPKYLAAQGIPSVTGGFVYTGSFFIAAAAVAAGGKLGDWLTFRFPDTRARHFLAGTALGTAAVLIVLAVISRPPFSIALLIGAFAISDVVLPIAWAVTCDLGQPRAGVLSGAMNTSGNVGAFACSLVFGYVLDATGSYSMPLLSSAAALATGSVAWLILTREPLFRITEGAAASASPGTQT